jgi:hypothetical protein
MSASRSPAPIVQKHPRSAGLALTAVGLALLSYFTLCPVIDAMRHAPEVSGFSAKGTLLGFVISTIGLIVVVGGKRALGFLNPPAGGSKAATYAVCVALIAAGFGLYFAVKAYIESLGYTFG